jgi:type II secretion system protein G
MRTTKGFTLIELLVVIAIIGILASIVMVSLSGAKSKSRDARRQADIKSIQLALSLYYTDNGMYPVNIYGTGASAPTSGLAPTYLPVVPTDPNNTAACGDSSSGGCYKYIAYTPGTTGGSLSCNNLSRPPVSYHLGATLENADDGGLTRDVDADSGGTYVYTNLAKCSVGVSGASSFNGLSAGKSSDNTGCSTTAGTAQPGGTETCYDVAP